MAKVLLFGGTTEGRLLATAVAEAGISTLVSVASETAAALLPHLPTLSVHVGRMTAAEMAALARREKISTLVDATHPYAALAHREIAEAAGMASLPYLRVARPLGEELLTAYDCHCFREMTALLAFLTEQTGKIFLTTGSKDLPQFAPLADRLIVRVLPVLESLQCCKAAGLSTRQILAMQGPFSEQCNEILFRESGAATLVTKVSGKAGGFLEKLVAARSCGMQIAVLLPPDALDGISWEAAKERLLASRKEMQ